MNDLIAVDNINPIDIFNGKELDGLLKKITVEAKSEVPDISTDKGRKAIASMAHKVAKTKTYLDGCRKDLVSDWKAKAKAVDGEGKKMRDYLDNLKAEVRQPLTEWEEAEEERVAKLNERVEEMTNHGVTCETGWLEIDLDVMKRNLETVKKTEIDTFEEYAEYAAKEKDKAILKIEAAIEKREKHNAEQAELEKLRAEAAEREEKEREEQLRLEGEKRAKEEADKAAAEKEATAKAEAEKAEREKQDAIKAQEDAERRAKEAEEESERKAEAAAQAERDRIESERVEKELAEKKREADTKHRAKINNAAMDALISVGLSEDHAKEAVTAIAKNQVPHVSISY